MLEEVPNSLHVSKCFSREIQGSVSLNNRGGRVMVLCDVEEYMLIDSMASISLSPERWCDFSFSLRLVLSHLTFRSKVG